MVLRPGRWFAVYVTGYGLGRLWVESLRIDTATLVFGVRVNIWMSLVAIAAAACCGCSGAGRRSIGRRPSGFAAASSRG